MVNAIAPIAATRLTEGILPTDLIEKLKPEFVTPLVIYLCSEQCPVTGAIYNAGMGYYSRAAVVTAPAAVLGEGGTIPTPEQLAANMDRIVSLEGAEESRDATAALGAMLNAISSPAQDQPSES